MYKRGFLRSTVMYLKDLSPYRRQFFPCSKSQNIIRVNLLGNHSTSYYYVVDFIHTYIPSPLTEPTVVPAIRFCYTIPKSISILTNIFLKVVGTRQTTIARGLVGRMFIFITILSIIPRFQISIQARIRKLTTKELVQFLNVLLRRLTQLERPT